MAGVRPILHAEMPGRKAATKAMTGKADERLRQRALWIEVQRSNVLLNVAQSMWLKK